MAFDKIVGVDGTTYQFPSVVRQRIADNIETVGSVENLAVIDALAPALATKSNTTHNHTLASLSSNGIDELGDVEIGVVGGNGIALADKHTLQYESSTSKWRNKVASGGVTVSDTPPATPIPGDAWFDSNDGTLYVYYTDVNTTQWVQVQANSALEGTILARLGAVESRATALEAVPDYAVNEIINGAFEINQRALNSTGTTVSTSFGFDRWQTTYVGGTVTYSAQTFSSGEAPLEWAEQGSFARIVTSGHTDVVNHYTQFSQRIEDARTLADKTVTFSFWAKGTAGLKVAIEAQQTFNNGSTQVNTYFGTATLTGSWTRYTYTATLPPISGTLGANSFLRFVFWTSAGTTWTARTNSIGIQNGTFDVWGVQAEAGSVATPFHRNANSMQGELAACQRYYQRMTFTVEAPVFTGQVYNVNLAGGTWTYPVVMRAVPTFFEVGGTHKAGTASGGTVTATVSFVNSTIYGAFLYLGATGGYGSSGQSTQLIPTVGAYIASSAEL